MGLSEKTRVYFLPRLRDILFISIFVGAMLLGPLMLNLDGDLPRHILTGKFILETRMVPTSEPFAYPYQGKPYVSHEWLTDVIFYLLYRVGGLAGIAVLSAFLLASTFYVLYVYTSSQSGLCLVTLFLVLWGAGATSLNWVTRPHLVSMLFLAIWLVRLDKLDKGEKTKLWHFPLFMLVWSNLHGEFIAGMLATLAYAAGWVWDYLFARETTKMTTGRNLFLVAGLSFLASLLNPAGIGPWKTLLGFVNNSYLMSRMYEARPPDFSQSEFLVLLGLLAVSIFLLAINRRKIPTSQAFLLTGFSAMSLIAGRNIHLYGIVAPFVLAGAAGQAIEVDFLQRIENSLARIEGNLKGVVWPSITIAAFVLFVPSAPAQKIYTFDPKAFPVQATDWIVAHPQSGKLFNDLNWGGYLALRLWPKHSVFVDSMADVSGELTREYEDVITLAPTWKDILSKYQVEWVVIPTSSRLVRALEQEGWTVLYQDKKAIIFKKNTSP